MAKIVQIDDKYENKAVVEKIARLFQSGNINFLIGSGASSPVIETAGNIESEIDKEFAEGNEFAAIEQLYNFILNLLTSNKSLLETRDLEDTNNKTVKALIHYKMFLSNIENILLKRRTNLLPKQANIYTTNYDVFIERAAEASSTSILNDGFVRTPNLIEKPKFSPQSFFNSTFNNGHLFNYKVEIPTINLLKIHGSLTWSREQNDIVSELNYSNPISKEKLTKENMSHFVSKFALVLPRKDKHQETLLDRVYYEMLRIFSNELDKENTALFVFGFSFADEHILDITKRALKNPTLQLVIFCYCELDAQSMIKKFESFNNVTILKPAENEFIEFDTFNEYLSCIFDTMEGHSNAT